MEAHVKAKLDEYEDKTARQKYNNNDKYIAFRTAIWVSLYALKGRMQLADIA